MAIISFNNLTKKAQKMLLEDLEFEIETRVYHSIREKFNLSINDYCAIDAVYHYSIKTDSYFPNWCYKGMPFFVKALGLSRATVYRIIKDLIEKELLIRNNENSFLRTTVKWKNKKENKHKRG